MTQGMDEQVCLLCDNDMARIFRKNGPKKKRIAMAGDALQLKWHLRTKSVHFYFDTMKAGYCLHPEHVPRHITLSNLAIFVMMDCLILDVVYCPVCDFEELKAKNPPEMANHIANYPLHLRDLAMMGRYHLFPTVHRNANAYYDINLMKYFVAAQKKTPDTTPSDLRREFAKYCTTPLPKSFEEALERFKAQDGIDPNLSTRSYIY
ncbi:hypothetical protein BC940DRAFT_297923 [Gongronella butleri]|nr:hypothetical protein BC940DRAFT_297923 [Gongronella butleri]